MAGTLAVIPVLDEARLLTAIREQWEVQFSRFFNYPAPKASKCPDLVPLPSYLRNRGSVGTWISSDGAALLRLTGKPSCSGSDSGTILDVSLGGKLLEEHYVSNLQFSWPQVKCISGFPARGTRSVFATYRDYNGEIQKFAIRFAATSETEAFVKSLKGMPKGGNDVKPLNNELGSAISSEPEFLSPNRPLYQASEVSKATTHVSDYVPEMPIYRPEPAPFTQETQPLAKIESNYSALPPSFTSLLTDFCPIVEQVAPYPSVTEDAALKSQIAKYMEDASFQDMLIKVERVINEMGGSDYAM